jgi:hypothetical protein
MVSYYPWPPMAVALIPAAALGWRRLILSGFLAGGLTAAAQGPSHDDWIWWAPIVAGLILLLALARGPRAKTADRCVHPGVHNDPASLTTPSARD